MKAIKIVLISILSIIGLILLIALFVPKEISLSREIVIPAPYELVYGQVISLKAHNDWSPWNERDPNLELRFEGIDGELGSKYYWKGNDEVGEGYEELIAVFDDKIETRIQFFEPWESVATTVMTLEQQETGVLVNWSFQTSNNFPMNIFNLMLESQLGPDFEYGLNKLKNLCIELQSNNQ